MLAPRPPLADPQALQAIPEPRADRTELNIAAFREGEVEMQLSKAENTAPGDDRITYRHWKQVDPECKVLTAIFNIWLQPKKIPRHGRNRAQSLYLRMETPQAVTNWRPIALCRTI